MTSSERTRVTERVEVDLGAVPNVLMKLPYGRLRGPAVRDGMARTLENLEARAVAGQPIGDYGRGAFWPT
jgi:hypothetical protein